MVHWRCISSLCFNNFKAVDSHGIIYCLEIKYSKYINDSCIQQILIAKIFDGQKTFWNQLSDLAESQYENWKKKWKGEMQNANNKATKLSIKLS